MTLGLLLQAAAQAAVAWSATCGTLRVANDSQVVYRPSQTSAGPCLVIARAGTAADTTVVRITQADVAARFPVGLSQWPADQYCVGWVSAAMQPVEPKDVLSWLQLAARCHVQLFLVPKRKLLTATGTTAGRFVVDSAKVTTDRFTRVLPADTLAKYAPWILGFNLGDDYACTACWGGVAITPAQVAQWAAYTKARMPGLPLGVRVLPGWVTPELAPLLDYAWAQYHTGKGDISAYYDAAAFDAKARGLRLVVGVNVEDCGGVATAACSPAQLLTMGGIAVQHPASCAFVNWQYNAPTFADSSIRLAWGSLAQSALRRAPTTCRRAAA